MAWLGKVSLGGFPDLAGAVTKLSESVKNIEKNFDSALGLEEKPDSGGGEASGIWPSVSDRKTLFDPVMAFMGHNRDGNAADAVGKTESPEHPSSTEGYDAAEASSTIENAPLEKESEHPENVGKDISDSPLEESRDKDSGDSPADDHVSNVPREPDEAKDEGEPTASLEFNKGTEQTEPNVSRELDEGKDTVESNNVQATTGSSHTGDTNRAGSVLSFWQTEGAELETNDERQSRNSQPASPHGEEQTEKNNLDVPDELHHVSDVLPSHDKVDREVENLPAKGSPMHVDVLEGTQESGQVIEAESSVAIPTDTLKDERTGEVSDENLSNLISAGEVLARDSDSVSHDILASSKSVDSQGKDFEHGHKEQPVILTTNMSDSVGPAIDVEKMKKEMKLMEAALQGAARQSQSKADEIARLMNENEKLKSSMEDLKRKSADAEVDALREEYHQRVAALERKVYSLSRERDALRREQSKKSDAALLLKEKDEIISQVMAEGEELSKKQAAQESTIRKLRAQIREFEEEKQRLNSKLQAEETKVESIRKDKTATEKLLQETIERNQAELAAQKEFYTNALNAAKEAEALAEARANNEARIELESRLREAGEREAMLVQTLDELRQTLSRTEQQAVFREDMLRRDINDLQNRYQASELRYNELITQVPDSTRPLLRQIEAMQETAARREEAWAGVERTLNSRLQEAEAKAAGAEERERALSERLSQSLSRITVLETQITCLRTEQTQLSRTLEKERQRAAENRQEYLAAMEEAATQEGRAKQLEDEIKEFRNKHKHELQEAAAHRELLQKELERERLARSELEKTASREISIVANNDPIAKLSSSYSENGNAPIRKLSSAGSLSSMEESYFLQASLDSSASFSERRETTMSPYFLKSMTPSAFEAALRQKDGELASYVSRLASLESIRDSLAEELVKMTAQCEKLRAEASLLPSIRAELDALRRRHSSALELMGERDEALEELRADITDLKEMYREQIDLLVNRIQTLSSSAVAA